MTIQEIFDYVDEIKLNSFSTLSKTIWLNEIEGKIQNEIMLLAQPECIRYVYESHSESGMEFKDDHTLVLPRPIKAHIGGLLTISDTEINDTTAEILNISSDGKTYSFAEGTFSNTGTGEGELDFDGKDTELLVQYPFDRIYASWLLVKISEHLEESAQDANSTAKFKDDWEIFAAWYADTYRPADGVPAFKGYYLTGKTGERGRDGAPGPAGKGIVRLYVESGRLKYELSDGSIGDAGAVSGIEIDPTLSIEGAAADAKATGDAIGAVAGDVTDIVNLIPLQASTQNQLADKAFVNSTVGTNTAYYISNAGQPFTSLAQLQAYSGTVTNNDYAFVVGADAAGNTTYTRYKYNDSTHTWGAEFVLNNSSFTAAQWSAIESGITAALVASYNAHIANGDIHVTAADKIAWNGKLDKTGGVISGNLGVAGELGIGSTVSVIEENVSLLKLIGDNGEPVRIKNVDTPIADSDVATKKYVDEHSGGGAFTVIEEMTVDEVSLLPDGAYVSRDNAGTWDYWLKGTALNVVTIYRFECMDDSTSSFYIYVGTAGNVENKVTIEASGGLSIGDMSLYASGEELKFNNKAIALKSDLDGKQDKALIVNITESGGTYTADKTNAEIYAAWTADKAIWAIAGASRLQIVSATATNAVFACVVTVGNAKTNVSIVINNDVVTAASTELQSTAITDTAGYYTTDTVEGALAEIGAKLAAYPSDVWEGGSYGS